MKDTPLEALDAPRSATELFFSFSRLALQGFGGVLPVAQRELVERKNWLNQEQFVELLSISQLLPGPNIVNLSLALGDRYFGLRGALAALGGLLAAPLMIVLALTVLYAQFSSWPMVAGALRGIGAVAAGLVTSTALKLATSLARNRLGRPLCAVLVLLSVAAMAWLRVPLVWVILGLGGFACVIAWDRLEP